MPQQAARVQWQPKVEPNLRGTQAAGCESRTDLALEVGSRRDQGSNPVPLDLEAVSFPLWPSGPEYLYSLYLFSIVFSYLF